MARLSAGDSEEVKLAKLRMSLDQYRSQQAHVTWRWLIVAIFLTASLGMMTHVIVKLNEKPAWLELVVFLSGSLPGPLFYWLRLRPRWRRMIDQLREHGDSVTDEQRSNPESTS